MLPRNSIHRHFFAAYAVLVATPVFFDAGSEVHARHQNPIVVENANPGTDAWKINQSANDTDQQIKGYASATSVNKGRDIDFHVSVNSTQMFSIDVYRMGWYNGAGGRLMRSIGSLNGTNQAPPLYDSATGMVSYQWETTYSLTIPTDWTSGIYLAKLTNSEGFENYISFVVRDDARSADLVYQQPVTTYQAYNAFPRAILPTPQALDLSQDPTAAQSGSGESDNPRPPVPQPVQDASPEEFSETMLADIGKSLYEFNSSSVVTDAGTTRALQVSFNRPYEGRGDGQFFNWEYYLVSWLERNGYDVAYATNIDLHRQGSRLLQRYKALISAGHDEYWSNAMYDATEQARDTGIDLAFLGSNAVYWQVQLTPDATGVADRTLVCYKSASLDPQNDPALETIKWRDVGRAEQSLLGVQYITWNEWAFNTDYIVTNSDHWVYAGTGFSDGDAVRGINGYEVDTLCPDVARPGSDNQTILAASPFTGKDGSNVVANASIYQAPGGAWVFAAGTMSLPWALQRDGYVDTRMQTTMENILRRFIDGDPQASTLIEADFDNGANGFTYLDDTFRNTGNAEHANGYYTATRGFRGGAIAVQLGSADRKKGVNMSGGWQTDFELTNPGDVSLSFRYLLTQSPYYESDEYSEMLLGVDGQLYGTAPNDYIARVVGDGNGGDWLSTGWQSFDIELDNLAAGAHRITIGGFGNRRSYWNEITEILIDDVEVVSGP